MEKNKLLIIGGVAGGASAAARARRISEDWEIVVLERGPHVSFANCGLPYYVGNVIKEQDHLLLADPDLFRTRFNIDVRVRNEAVSVNPGAKIVRVRNLETGQEYDEAYDSLLLSPGAAPVRPGLPGIDLPGIFTVRNIPDATRIMEWIDNHETKHAVVVGAGYIGLEMCENLMERGIEVTIVEMQDQALPILDREMATYVHEHLAEEGVELILGQSVTGFSTRPDGDMDVALSSGESLQADLVVMSIGVRPEVSLARDAGLTIGETGGILVDDTMRTSDPHIWAVGDAVEVTAYVTGVKRLIPLAGPANRQGRLAADVILGNGGPPPRFRGVQGTSVCGFLGLTVANTGETEKTLDALARAGRAIDYEKVYIHNFHHSSYYPGAEVISLKLLFEKPGGRILGAQAVGKEGTEKRIDVIAMAIQLGGTVQDLEQAELCYAPQYGAAKDPVNIAGMVAANYLAGFAPIAHWEDVDFKDGILLDVRSTPEVIEEIVEGATHIHVGQLRSRLGELPRDRDIYVFCHVGQRAHIATRMLREHGYRAYNLTGGYLTHIGVEGMHREDV
ncbi:MAG: FAD-dependent oxidoreductase [Desulfatibacillaceae bacterium]